MSTFMERLLAKAEEVLWEVQEPDPIPPSQEHAIGHDTFDQMTWDGLTGSSKAIQQTSESLAEQFEAPGERAFQDLFNLLYKSDPRITGANEMLPEFAGNRRLMEDFTESEEVKALREHTVLDDFQSGFAILAMEQQFREALEKVREAQEKQQQAEQGAQGAAEQLQQAQQAAQGGQGGPDEDQLAQALQQALEDHQSAQDAAQQAQQEADATTEQATEDMAHAASNATDEIEKTNAKCRQYGYGSGQLQRMPFDERRDLVQRLNRGKVQAFAALIGSYRVSSRAERRRRVKHQPGETYDYELGDDLTRLVSTERDAMAIPELEESFWLRYVRHELLLANPHGIEKAGRGPIMIVCDESDSMDTQLDALGNTREAWSKAVALSLCEQARKEQRDFTYIGFDGKIVYEATYKKGQIGLRDLIEFVEHFGGGGTEFMAPLTRAAELLAESEHRDEDKADVVFITDGDGHINEEFATQWRADLARLDSHCYAIQVGDDTTKVHAKLRMLTDKVIRIDRLNANPAGVSELFRNI